MKITDQRLAELIKHPGRAHYYEIREIATRLLASRDVVRIVANVSHVQRAALTAGVPEHTLCVLGPGGDFTNPITQ